MLLREKSENAWLGDIAVFWDAGVRFGNVWEEDMVGVRKLLVGNIGDVSALGNGLES